MQIQNNRMLQMIEQKLDSIETKRVQDKKELQQKFNSARAATKQSNKKQYIFKFKSNKIQNDLLDDFEELNNEAKELLEAGSRERLASTIDGMLETIKKRRKVLILADRSPAGWDTVAEYLTDEWASDSDDNKKM